MFFLTLQVVTTLVSFGQSQERTYLDEFGFPTEGKDAKSFLVIEQHPTEPRKLLVTEYFVDAKIKERNTYSDIELYTKDGLSTTYYPNGQKKEEGFFKENTKVSKWIKWYANGQVMEEGHFEEAKRPYMRFKVDNSWDSLGQKHVVNQLGQHVIFSDNSDQFDRELGEISGGLKNGNWTGYKNEEVAYKEEYDMGKLIRGESFDHTGRTYKYEKINDFDLTPFYNFVSNTMRYPADARRSGIQGTIVVQILFDSEGRTIRYRLVKGIGGGCDEEALRVIDKYNGKWKGAKRRGQQIEKPQNLYLPVTFKLG